MYEKLLSLFVSDAHVNLLSVVSGIYDIVRILESNVSADNKNQAIDHLKQLLDELKTK